MLVPVKKRGRKSPIFLEQGAALRSSVWADIGSWAKSIENHDSRFFIGRIAEKKKATHIPIRKSKNTSIKA